MNEYGKSDSLIIPEKQLNKGGGSLRPAEGVEGMRLAEGNSIRQNRSRTQIRGALSRLSDCLERGAYRAKLVRRTYIPKTDGRKRPIGVPVLEDKIVQRAAVEVLNAIYEADFLRFSYGFRPGRSQHRALDAVTVGIESNKVNWVLDVDIRGFFDAISHEWMIRFIVHRIKDKRVTRHIRKWLKAGVLEEGQKRESDDIEYSSS